MWKTALVGLFLVLVLAVSVTASTYYGSATLNGTTGWSDPTPYNVTYSCYGSLNMNLSPWISHEETTGCSAVTTGAYNDDVIGDPMMPPEAYEHAAYMKVSPAAVGGAPTIYDPMSIELQINGMGCEVCGSGYYSLPILEGSLTFEVTQYETYEEQIVTGPGGLGVAGVEVVTLHGVFGSNGALGGATCFQNFVIGYMAAH